jgi:hypothetical protein
MTPRRANRLARWAYYTKISAKACKTPPLFLDAPGRSVLVGRGRVLEGYAYVLHAQGEELF